MADPRLESAPQARGADVPFRPAGQHRWAIPTTFRQGMKVEGLIEDEHYSVGAALLERVVAMLTKMIAP